MWKSLNRLWRWLTGPSPSAPGPWRSQSTLLAGLLIALIVVTLSVSALLALPTEFGSLAQPGALAGTLATAGLFGVAFYVNRRNRYRAAALLTVSSAALAAGGLLLISHDAIAGDPIALAYLIIPILLSGLLLSLWPTLAVIAGGLLVFWEIQRLSPAPGSHTQTTLVFFAIGSALASAMAIIRTQNLTELERQDAALAESIARFQNAFENAAIGMALVSPSGRWLQVNRSLCALTGYSEPELLAIDFQTITHPDDLQADLGHLQQLVAGVSAGYQMEKRYYHKQGHIVWVMLSVSLVRDRHGQPAYFISQIQDVSERKQAEAELRESREQYRRLVDQAEDIIYETDQAGRLTFVNPAATRLLGYAETALLGRIVWELLPDAQREPALRFYERQVAARQASTYYELPILAQDGGEHWIGQYVHLTVRDGHLAGFQAVARDMTERRRTEQALQAAEAKYRTLVEQIPAITYIAGLDEAGGTRYVSPQVQMLGISPEDYLADPQFWEQRLHPEDRQRVLAARDRTQVSGEPFFAEYRLVLGEGREVWIRDEAAAVLDEQGRPLFLQGLMLDVTALKQAEAALRESGDRYRSMFEEAERLRQFNARLLDVMAEGLALEDAGGMITYSNFRLQALLGYTAAELVGQHWSAVVPPSGQETVAAQFARRQANQTSTYELRLLAKDGRLVPVLVSATPLLEAGQFAGVLATFTDISERLAIEDALRKSEERFRSLSNSSPVGIFQTDVNGDCVYTNARWQAITGLSAEAALGQGWLAAIHPDDRDWVAAAWDDTLRDHRPFAHEFRFLTPVGTVRWVQARVAPIETAQGEAVGYVGTDEDVTERKLDEQALLKANERLEGWLARLEAYTREIAQLNELSNLLQTCLSPEEAYGLVQQLGPQLFPRLAGMLAISAAGGQAVEVAATWGGFATDQPAFVQEHCWALRRGRPHWYEAGQGSVPCPHLGSSHPSATLCVPLLAQSEILGLLHLQVLPSDDEGPVGDTSPLGEAQRSFAQTVADSLSLALANLQLQAHLRERSIRDPLTGLFNRRYLEETLERELHRAERSGTPLSVLMLDIDHFKQFNDTYGHGAGDALLGELGRLLQSHIRAEDIACRYGGEEFVLVLPGCANAEARQRAEWLSNQARQLQATFGGQTLGQITLSLGVAAFPDQGPTQQILLQAADEAMYAAKRAGRDRVLG